MNDIFIINCALKTLRDLAATENEVSLGKLHSSWANIEAASIKIVNYSDDYVVVRAMNYALLDTTFLMLSNAGELYEINDTGNF